MAKSKEFQSWHKLECAKRLGNLEDINKILDEQLNDKNLKIEYF